MNTESQNSFNLIQSSNSLTPNTSHIHLNTFLVEDLDVDFELINPSVEPHFAFLRRSTITSFFAVNLVDMPVCFKKSKSLYSKTFEVPLFKFTNIIMRHGKREQVIKNVTYSFTKCFHQIIKVFNHPEFIH